MTELNQLKELIPDRNVYPDKISVFIQDKGNAKLGDALVNFIYSIAKSQVLKASTGANVADYVLSESFKQSNWKKRNRLKITGDKGKIADRIEALILYFWIKEEFCFDFFIRCLSSHLEENKLHHPKNERFSAVNAFKFLLDELYNKYESKNDDSS